MNIKINSTGSALPKSSLQRIDQAEQLAKTIQTMLSSSLSRPAFRAAWTLIDKVLNKALDFDARILHPELFSTIAVRLDLAVRNTLFKILNVAHLPDTEDQCLRLAIEFGGCGIIAASRKKSFSHLAAACQYLPAVGQALENMGWNNDQINNAIDFSGIQWCLDSLANQSLRIAVDGTIKHDVSPTYLMTPEIILSAKIRNYMGFFRCFATSR